MRLHTSLTPQQIIDALTAEKEAGRIASHVMFKRHTQHRSTIRLHAFEVQLEAAVRDRGRRAGNSGSYGAMRPEYGGYAATHDEWGWFLARLFELDPGLHVGSASAPVYAGRTDFDVQTGLSYHPSLLLAAITDGDGDPYPYVTGNAARTKRGYLIGRAGYGRLSTADGEQYERRGWPVAYRPRTAEWVREFAHLDAEAVAR